MKAKTYRVKSMREALELIRRDLGPQASILHTRKLNDGWLRRVVGAQQLEVVASSTVDTPSRLPDEPATHASNSQTAQLPSVESDSIESFSAPAPSHNAHDESFECSLTDWSVQPISDNGFDLTEISWPPHSSDAEGDLTISDAAASLTFPSEDRARDIEQLARHWRQLEIQSDTIQDWSVQAERLLRVTPEGNWQQRLSGLVDHLQSQIHVAGPIQSHPQHAKRVAVVGPTGVGKTTTLAKLAATYRLKHQWQVGLLTVDTYRIAAVDQLKTYADILEVPLEVVSTPREMKQAVDRMKELDLVLIDTAGRSPHEESQLQELKSLLQAAGADEVLLVLSATASAQGLNAAAAAFGNVGVTSMVLTKLDEVRSLGNAWPVLSQSRLPIRYTTSGQNVPHDIQVAESVPLAEMVLGMGLLSSQSSRNPNANSVRLSV